MHHCISWDTIYFAKSLNVALACFLPTTCGSLDIAKHGLVGSMSRKGNCLDNAVTECFFLNLKMERVWHKDYANHAEATHDIADYIVGFYNSFRLHSKLGNLSHNAFERESTSKNPSNCPKLLDHYTVIAMLN